MVQQNLQSKKQNNKQQQQKSTLPQHVIFNQSKQQTAVSHQLIDTLRS